MNKFLPLTVLLTFAFLTGYSQNIRFSYDIVQLPSDQVRIDVYGAVKSGEPNETLGAFSLRFAYNSTAAQPIMFSGNHVDFQPVVNLGWGTSSVTDVVSIDPPDYNSKSLNTQIEVSTLDENMTYTTLSTSRTLFFQITFQKTTIADGALGGWFYMMDYRNVGSLEYGDGDYNTVGPVYLTGGDNLDDVPYIANEAKPLSPIPTLPVTLINFSAQNNDNKSAKLNWTVTQEYNASHYVVERSYDGKNFSALTQVPAQNKTELNTYAIEDKELKLDDGTTSTVYYRLTLVDLDGSSKVYDVRSVKFVLPGNKMEIQAHPNPFIQSIQITIPSTSAQGAWVSLSNANGQVVYSQQHTLSNGRNLLQIKPKATLNSGSYFLTVVLDNGITFQQKLLRGRK